MWLTASCALIVINCEFLLKYIIIRNMSVTSGENSSKEVMELCCFCLGTLLQLGYRGIVGVRHCGIGVWGSVPSGILE